jgi:polysaccharide biosynthesis protein PslA
VSKGVQATQLVEDLLHHAKVTKHSNPSAPGKRISLQQCVAELVMLDCALLILLGLLPLSLGAGSAGVSALFSGLSREFEAILLGVAIFLAGQRAVRGYRSRHILDHSTAIWRLVLALFVTFSLLIALAAASKVTQDYSRLWFFGWVGSSFVVLPLVRLLTLQRFGRALREGCFVFRALSVGVRCDALSPVNVAERTRGLSMVEQSICVWDLDNIPSLAREVRDRDIDEVYLTVAWALVPEVLNRVSALRSLSANVYVVPVIDDAPADVEAAAEHGDGFMVQVVHRPLQGWNDWLKRKFDIVVALLALVLLSPLLAAIAIAISLDGRGPVLFRQVRQGFNGVEFELVKFRSMYVEDTDHASEVQTSANDCRVTRVGRFIRRTSLDELPQIFNVLQGHMSIVGPRPHALKTSAEGKLLGEAVSDYAWRQRVKPGITGWAQVNGLRGELNSVEKLRKRVRYDTQYIDNWSIGFDVAIVLRTAWLLFHDPNAY